MCGRIVGYQYGDTRGFSAYHFQGYTIDTCYIDGISVTYGQSPRKHIWTFAAGRAEEYAYGSYPCGNLYYLDAVPPYIGNNYFCETGTTKYPSVGPIQFYSDDPLWDGEGCGLINPRHICECTLHNPPWFTTNLSDPTTDNIEVRSCGNRGTSDRNVGIELIELYVK